MGCCGGSMPGGDNEVTEILKEVTAKILEIQKEYNTLEESMEKDKILKERHEDLAGADKNNEAALTKLIKDYNKKELEIDNELIKKEEKASNKEKNEEKNNTPKEEEEKYSIVYSSEDEKFVEMNLKKL